MHSSIISTQSIHSFSSMSFKKCIFERDVEACWILNIRKIDILSRNHTSPSFLSSDTLVFLLLSFIEITHWNPPFLYPQSSLLAILRLSKAMRNWNERKLMMLRSVCLHWYFWSDRISPPLINLHLKLSQENVCVMNILEYALNFFLSLLTTTTIRLRSSHVVMWKCPWIVIL